MFFSMPTKVYAELDCIANHQKALTAFGSHALIVTGRNSAKKCGALNDTITALHQDGIPYTIFDQVEENPSLETILAAKEIGHAAGADFVIGIGGGSPLDAAKAIAVLLANPEQDTDFLYASVPAKAMPVAAIPTTCGTGSEVTQYAVLTVHSQATKITMKHHIFPEIALIDPRYLAAAPLSLLRNTAMDAFAHLVESFLNTKATDFSRMAVREGLRIWNKSIKVLMGVQEPTFEDFQNLMIASTLAGIAISHTGTSLPHGLSYPLTYDLGMAHGVAVGYFLTGYLQEAAANSREEVLRLAGFSNLEAFTSFYQYTCQPQTVPAAVIERSVAALLENPAKLASCPYPVDETILRRIAGI